MTIKILSTQKEICDFRWLFYSAAAAAAASHTIIMVYVALASISATLIMFIPMVMADAIGLLDFIAVADGLSFSWVVFGY